MGVRVSDGRLIDFKRAEVITPMIYPPQPRLVVAGVKPHPDVQVTLVPLMYVSRPTYQGIQVVATATSDGPHVSQPIANVPYTVEIDLHGICGGEGVEVIGETKTQQVAVAPADPEAASPAE